MIKKFLLCGLAAVMLGACLCACRAEESDHTAEPPEVEAPELTEQVKYVYQLVQKELEYVSEETVQSWREPLIRLIENKAIEVYDGDSLDGYKFPYPDRPGIMPWWELGLFDLDLDGTPELLVNRGGGSSGNSYYEVHDILTGEQLGSMNAGGKRTFCVYFNRNVGQNEVIAEYDLRFGWDTKVRFVDQVGMSYYLGNDEKRVYKHSYLCAVYRMDLLVYNKADNEQGIVDEYNDILCTQVEFEVNGVPVPIETYFIEYDHFRENYSRLSSTELLLVDKYKGTTEEIVDALLSTGQKFLKPEAKPVG